MAPYVAYAGEIYRSGRPPALPTDPDGLEEAARAVLPPEAFWYVGGRRRVGRHRCGPTGRRSTAWRIVPRMLRDATVRDLGTTVLGTAMPAPVLLAPVGVQSILHPDGELATARAAAALGLPMVLSTASSYTHRGGRRGRGDGPRWYQLYWPNDDAVTASLLGRAQRGRVHGARRHARHVAARLAPARPRRAPTCRSCAASAPRSRSPTRRSGPGSPSRRRRTSPPRSLRWVPMFTGHRQELGPAGVPARALAGPIVLKGILHPDDARARGRRRAWTGSSCPTTAAARWTARSARSTRCRAWSTAVGGRLTCCSTAASGAGPTMRQGAGARGARRAARPALRLRAGAWRRGRGTARAAQPAGRPGHHLAVSGYATLAELRAEGLTHTVWG